MTGENPAWKRRALLLFTAESQKNKHKGVNRWGESNKL